MNMPKLKTPREACIAALSALIHGGGLMEAQAILTAQDVTATIEPKGLVEFTATVRMGRRRIEEIASSQTYALTQALTNALTDKQEPQA